MRGVHARQAATCPPARALCMPPARHPRERAWTERGRSADAGRVASAPPTGRSRSCSIARSLCGDRPAEPSRVAGGESVYSRPSSDRKRILLQQTPAATAVQRRSGILARKVSARALVPASARDAFPSRRLRRRAAGGGQAYCASSGWCPHRARVVGLAGWRGAGDTVQRQLLRCDGGQCRL